jgi:hypothetical protein
LDFSSQGKLDFWMGGLMEMIGCQRLQRRKKYFQKSGENPAAGITRMRLYDKRGG